jgi:O-antigen/teichoic acid export membrane protein
VREVNFGVQVTVGFVGRVVSVASAFLGSIAIARIVGPDTYGQFYVLLGIVSILDNPLTGWGEGARKRMTESQVSQREAAGAALLPLIVGVAVISIASLVLYVVETNLVSDTVAVLLPVMFLAVASFTVSFSIIKGTARFGGVSWLQALDDLVRIGGQLGLILAGYGLGGMVGGFVAAKLLLVPVIIKLSGIRPKLPNRELLVDIWKFAKHSIPGKVVGTALGRMDILLLSAFASAAAAGQYQVAMNITTPAMFLTTVAAPGVVNRVSNLDSIRT